MSTRKKEKVFYLVNIESSIYTERFDEKIPSELTDEEFISVSEESLSLEDFILAFNNADMNLYTDYVRCIEKEVAVEDYNDSNVTVNIVELSSELAHEATCISFGVNVGEDSPIIFVEDEDGGTRYTEEAQNVFNVYYDFYYSKIENLSE